MLRAALAFAVSLALLSSALTSGQGYPDFTGRWDPLAVETPASLPPGAPVVIVQDARALSVTYLATSSHTRTYRLDRSPTTQQAAKGEGRQR